MTTPTAPFAALSASGLSYERLVSIFKLVQDRATNANASDILDFLQDNLSHDKFAHLSPEQRARMQVSLRALQEYALDVWRASGMAQAAQAAQSGAFPVVSQSGGFQAVAPALQSALSSGQFPIVNSPSGSFTAVMHTPAGPMPVVAVPAAPINRGISGGYPVVSHSSGAFPTASQSGSFPAIKAQASFSPATKRGFGQRLKDSFKSLFGKTPETPQLPNLSMDVTNAMLSPGE